MMKKTLAVLFCCSIILSGCTANSDESTDIDEILGCMDENAKNYDIEATNDDGSCDYTDENTLDNPITIPHIEGCDNTNPIHCMLPFPSDAFLIDDDTTNTGKRIHYSQNTIPSSGTVSPIEIPILNQMDGASPNTQIMTAFTVEPDVSELAGQYSIGKSLDSGHSTVIINQFNGELVAHWVELDARSEIDQPTIIHMRTVEALDHNTSYVVLLTGLMDENNQSIPTPEGFAALRDDVITTSPDIENRRGEFKELFNWISENTEYSINELQTAWSFHTSSTESMIGPLLSMRNDALERTGNGIGCKIESNTKVMIEENTSHWLITGTFTAPQYTESFFPPALIRRTSTEDRTPVFVENREIPFWLVIPGSSEDIQEAAKITIWGHGFLGNGNTSGLSGWANENNVAMLGTSFYGWSDDDSTSIEYAVLNMQYFQHQAERLEQAMINQVVMIKTFMGVCSDLPDYYTDDGYKLIDTNNPTYTGYSNGALRGPSIIGLSPDLNRGVLWAGGSSFSHIIERCTQYDAFHFIFASEYGYDNQLDRAVAMSIIQSLWDSTETDTFLSIRENGYLDEIEPFELMTLFSISDLQISNISSSRMMRTGGIPLLDSSTITPYGLDIVEDGHIGSVGVFFDGGYIQPPVGNEYGQEPHPAHNAIGALPIAREMAFQFLSNGSIVDTCEGNCEFSQDNLGW
tara:strand:+ start:7823 stop:9892 length:2070 start_codon:yes stop_codon:yes gene_type:complete